MCLIVNIGITNLYKNSKKKKIVCWKVVNFYYANEFYTPYQSKKVNGGWFKSNAYLDEPKEKRFHSEHIDTGIHVFQNLKSAKNMGGMYSSRKVIKCYGLKKDLIAANDTDLVFTKIWIPASELKKARKKK